MPGPGKPFEKGWQGGPGRPKGSGRVDLCRKFAEEEGFQKLIDLARGKGYKVGTLNGKITEIGPSQELQFEALKLALAYGYGKPTEFVDISSGGATFFDWLGEQFQFATTTTNGHSSDGHSSVTTTNGHPGTPSGPGTGPQAGL